MNSSYLWLIVTLSITNHYIFQLDHATDVSLQNCVQWVSHWQCELPPITYDSAGIQSVSVYISRLLFLGVSFAQDLFNYVSKSLHAFGHDLMWV